MYTDNESKFVAVLNRKVDLPKLFNALGHITAGLASRFDSRSLELLDYRDAGNSVHPGISRFPFIVLQADNSNQIRTLRQRLIEVNLPFTDFVDTMLGSSAEGQLANTSSTQESDLEYFAICTFGTAGALAQLVKKFSVYRGPAAVTSAPPQVANPVTNA